MVVTTEYVDITVDGSTLRMLLAKPKESGKYPAIICYSDIFQITGPMIRACVRLAGHGFIVAAPEIYHRIEPPGSAIAFDDAGRIRGLEDAAKTPVAHFDADCRAVLDYLKQHPNADSAHMGAAGFCIGGHLAFRAALNPEIQSTVCFYPTGLHNGKLGQEQDAGSLERAKEIRGDLLLIFGTLDPHIPEEGRQKIQKALNQSRTKFSIRHFPAEHAFMRDEGPRYDPEATDEAWSEAIHFFHRLLG
jgi:carboxymethylenebutenolidase